MNLAFDFLKGNIASWNPEDEIADKFEGLRMLNPMHVQRGRAGAPVSLEGDNSQFEEGVSDMGYETVPGWAEGENVAGTWLYPNIINPLAKPDFQMNQIQPAALIGSFKKPDWWRKQQLAPYGEGFKYHGIPDRDLRQIELPKGTQLGDINEAAQAIMENRAPRTVYQRGRWGSERVPEIHNILSQMNLEQVPVNRYSTFEPWEGKRVTSIPAQDPDRDWRDDYDMKVASEPMDLAMRLLKYDDYDDDFIRHYFYQTARNAGISEEEIDRAWEESQYWEPPIPPGDPNNLHPGDEGEGVEEGRRYFPTQLKHRDASPGVKRSVQHDDHDIGTFRDTPFNESTYFTTGEPMDLAWRMLKQV